MKYIMSIFCINFITLSVLAENSYTNGINKVNTSSDFWTAGPIIALALGVIASCLCVWLFLKTEDLKKKISVFENSTKKDIKNNKQEIIDQLKKDLADLNRELDELKANQNDMSKNISAFNIPAQPKTFEKPTPSQNIQNKPIHEEQKVENTQSTKYIYFGPPRGNRFSAGRATFTPGQSIYRVVDNGRSSVEFSFADQKEALSVALRSISDYIESACIIVGNPSSNPTKVVTLKPGLVKKEGNDWVIENKAQINLI